MYRMDDEDSYDNDSKPGGMSEAERMAHEAMPPPLRSDGRLIGTSRWKPLTAAQSAFVDGIVAGKTQYQAYRDSHPLDTSARPTQQAAAHRLCKHPAVAAALEARWDERAEVIVSDVVAQRRWIVGQLLQCATELRADGARLKALELLARSAGLFTSHQVDAAPVISAAQLKRELAGHLNVIEASSRRKARLTVEDVNEDEEDPTGSPSPLNDAP